MSYTFYATFIPGLQKVIAEVVKERLPDAKIHRLLDGAILFETSCTYDKLNFFCFNNIFAVINVMECGGGQALEKHIAAVAGGKNCTGRTARQDAAATEIIVHNNRKFHTFRIVVSNENKPAAIDEKLRIEAEQYISRISGLSVNRAKPDAEFWFLYRSEGFSLFMKRLTLRPSWEKTLHPGELPPPLAWTLCRLAGLKHGDTALDPFCGYGSIPFAAFKFFHITKFIAVDNDKKAAAYTKNRFKDHAGDSFVIYQSDFHSLDSLVPENSIDVIVTDPPWGFFEAIQTERFYEEMFSVFEKALKANGRLVVLCAKTDELLNAAAGHFQLQREIPILLSGKKASIRAFLKQEAVPIPL